MVRHKSALFGLALSLAVLGMTACEQKDVVIPPEPPPPLQISVTPAAITIEEGETAQMVAQVTGGETGGDKSVTWASSNTSVATVAANGNVVTITGVAEGTSTISATAAADANVSAAAVVTVEAAGGSVPPTVSIKSITAAFTNAPVNINNVFGQIEITLNLDVPQGTQVDRVEILADGEVVYTQSFTGVELGLAVDEAQSAVELVASWNTSEFDRSQLGTAGNVQGDWPNGDTEIQVQVIGPQGTITATTSTNIVLNNAPFLYTRLNLPATTAVNTGTGLAWYTGDINVDALGVKFNDNPASDVSSITMTNTGSDVATVADGTAADGFDLTLQKSGGSSGSRINALETGAPGTPAGVVLTLASVTAGGTAGPACIVTENSPTPLNLGCVGAVPANQMPLANPLNWDNVAPAVTLFDISPYTLACATTVGGFPPLPGACYVSGNPATPAFAFQVAGGFFAHTDAGVGSPTATFMAGEPGSLIPVTTGEDLAESVVPNYQLSATTCDGLQNCATVYAGPPSGVGFPATGTIGTVLTSATGAQLFGVDSTDPTATVDNATPNNSINAGASPAWTISFSDAGVGPSGFSAMPVRVQLKKTTPAGETCYVPDSPFSLTTDACTTSSGIKYQTDDGIVDVDLAGVPGAGEGYWQITSFVLDQAMNFSKPNTDRITLNDVTMPVLGGIGGPSSLPGGGAATFSAALSDNVDLGTLGPSLDYAAAGGPPTFQFPNVTLGLYGTADGLVSSTTGSFTVSAFVRGIEGTLATGRSNNGVMEANQVRFDVADVAGNLQTGVLGINGAVQFAAGGAVPNLGTIAPTIFSPGNVVHGNLLSGAPSAATTCALATGCGTTPASTVLTATMTGPNSTFANPFVRVEFYYQDPINSRWYLIGSGAPSASDNTVTSTRTWTYSATWTVTGLTASDGTAFAATPGTAIPVVAVAVHSSGSAVATTAGGAFGAYPTAATAGGFQTVNIIGT